MNTNSANPVLVEVLRGGHVESFHRGAVAISDAQGKLHTALGDIERPIFPRSAVKLLQALPLVASGAADALGLTNEELALACASHGGEPHHTATAASMLAKAGLDHTALECGAHWPYFDGSLKALAATGQQPTALNNNCSGKHGGFVCLAHHLHRSQGSAGALRGFLSGYVKPEHSVMQTVTQAMQAATGWNYSQAPRGVDGCSIPTYAVPLRHLAHAYAKVAASQGLSPEHNAAARRLRHAVAQAPSMVAGTGRFDSLVTSLLGERAYCKVGAEGVYCAALPELGLGVAIKMDDGNNARACEAVMAAVIQAQLKLSPAENQALDDVSHSRQKNWRGIEVGSLKAKALA